MTEKEKLRTLKELEERYQVPLATLYYWRRAGTGPAAIRVGKHLRFREEDLRAWEDAHRDKARQ
jgi:predicted site-specific integrase-resolvase